MAKAASGEREADMPSSYQLSVSSQPVFSNSALVAARRNLPTMNVTGQRLREAMADRDVSQAALARAIGISQGAVSAILFDKTRHSKHLADIAVELGVSYDWLLGRDVDKHADSPIDALLTPDEASILSNLRALPFPDRHALTNVMGKVFESHQSSVSALSALLPNEQALRHMFVGLLRPFELAREDELARTLARQLPKGLRLLQGPLVEEEDQDAPASERAEAPPNDRPARQRATRR